jgi:DNA repair photolyase
MLDIMQQLKFKRKFFSNSTKCKLGCLYCFADIDGFKKLDILSFHTEKKGNEDVLIYYPSCDTEFIWMKAFDDFIQKLIDSGTKSIISIATKSKMGLQSLNKIGSANNLLMKNGIGFIKLSVSITNKSIISVIEPRTSSYKERIELLKYLKENNIPSSVVLKPILPFITDHEYFEIVSDTSPFINNYLIGGLYLSKDSEFYKEYIENKFEIINKQVNWLPYNPSWLFVESTEKINTIRNYISEKNKKSFLSDQELLEVMWEEVIESNIL